LVIWLINSLSLLQNTPFLFTGSILHVLSYTVTDVFLQNKLMFEWWLITGVVKMLIVIINVMLPELETEVQVTKFAQMMKITEAPILNDVSRIAVNYTEAMKIIYLAFTLFLVAKTV